ncbi:MAG: L,D-transpeptidase family protein [Candidatus Cyclobacteriaceae bacterium M2_1C_046]
MKYIDSKRLLMINILIICILSSCSNVDEFDINNEKIRGIVESNADSVDVEPFFPDQDVRSYLHQEFIDFYKERDYTLAWLSFDEPLETADELLLAIDAAEEEGLSPEHYNLEETEKLLSQLYNIESRKKRRKEWRKKLIKSKRFKERFRQQDTILFNQIVKLDFLMTASYLTYSSHLLSGKINPNETAEWYSEPRKTGLSSHLAKAIEEKNIQKSLKILNPPHIQYEKLKEYLIRYREIADKGGWNEYKMEKELQLGDTGTAVVKLKKRLAAEGFSVENPENGNFNQSLKKKIQTYQMLHGIEISGKTDDATRTELNKPVEEVIKNIVFNMERMRWIHGPFGDHYVLVNIPAFQMSVIKDNKVQLQMKAIVGETVNKTPIFNDTIEYIVFSPEWNVPRSIAINEMLPLIKKNPYYLTSKGFKLYPDWNQDSRPISPGSVNWEEVTPENFNFRIVEAPGPRNSLGKVKFIFPNSKSIYLHDTPADYLFSENVRNFSHGCIRLEKPKDFAMYLLADKGMTDKEVEENMNRPEPKTILLNEKIPVYIVYWTAWVDEKSGLLNLRDDVYFYDKAQMKKIEEKEQKLKKAEIKA